MTKKITTWLGGLLSCFALLCCVQINAAAANNYEFDLECANVKINISSDDISISGQGRDDVLPTHSSFNPFADTLIIIGNSSTHTISITGDSGGPMLNLTLANVNISSDSASPISIGDNCNVTLNLEGTNFLTSSEINKNAALLGAPTASLTINGTGTLKAEQSNMSAKSAAIGGNSDSSGGNITI
ncbi:MAG: hypothetical protein ACRDBM_03700, partial [Sporomusa sp.]